MTTPRSFALAPIRPDWLATRVEAAIEPNLPIIDAHHHLFDRPDLHYLLEDYLADLGRGHNILASVYVQARAAYRTEGPEALRPVGETEFAAQIAEMALKRGGPRVCEAIVSYADLMLGDAVTPVLEAHFAAASGRLRGIRHILAWDADQRLLSPAYPTSETMMDSTEFRAGLAKLTEFNLSFDAWLHFHQLPRLTALARALPQTRIVLNHCGGILGIGPYAAKRDDVFTFWRIALRELAACPSVSVKLGGLGMVRNGFGFEAGLNAPSSAELANAWRPWIETAIEAFGSSRAMFESNAPVDLGGHGYSVGWNAFKLLTQNASASEKADLFHGTAARFYGIELSSLFT